MKRARLYFGKLLKCAILKYDREKIYGGFHYFKLYWLQLDDDFDTQYAEYADTLYAKWNAFFEKLATKRITSATTIPCLVSIVAIRKYK